MADKAVYIAFVGDCYYPFGGARDDHRLFDSLDAAKDWCLGQDIDSFKWAHVAKLTSDGLDVVWRDLD